MGLGFELAFAKQALYYLSHISIPLCSSYFVNGVLRTYFLGWL
jgi:hypothetical protein